MAIWTSNDNVFVFSSFSLNPKRLCLPPFEKKKYRMQNACWLVMKWWICYCLVSKALKTQCFGVSLQYWCPLQMPEVRSLVWGMSVELMKYGNMSVGLMKYGKMTVGLMKYGQWVLNYNISNAAWSHQL